MELRLTTFFACLMFVLACVSGLPFHGKDHDWKTCKIKSIELNKLARELPAIMNEPCKNMSAEFKDDLKIEGRVCDPYSFQKDNQKCRQSITGVLQNFLSIFGENRLFHSDDANVAKMVTDIHTTVAEILVALGGKKNEVTGTEVNKDSWQHCMLRKHSVMRLFTFSILSARVCSFAADPITVDSLNQCQ